MAGCMWHRQFHHGGRGSQEFLNPVGRNLTMVKIAITAGGYRVQQMQSY
jgi:hypothetical protein